ncbi:hypothetical protein SVAN01_09971 [Stagonosporopsis vannaccii]|nr:hypothetical protein SVAN01_09971 [Stagonosporopsis vannaccii]
MLTLNRRRRDRPPPVLVNQGSVTTALSPFGTSISKSWSRRTKSRVMKVCSDALDTLLTIVDRTKRTMPKRVRTPNCTHVNMDRIYGRGQQCNVCGRAPSIGFLYECRQDCSPPSLHDLLSATEDAETGRIDFSLRSELEATGLSKSVIRAAEQGHYTPAQLEILKIQKQDLKQTIEDSIQGIQINDVVARLAAFASTPSNNDGAMNSKTNDAPTACAFRACHTCRPYYRDRVYISFDAVASADFPPVTRQEAEHLPTKSADILRSIRPLSTSKQTRADHEEQLFTSNTTVTFATSTDAPNTASTTSDSSELTFKTTQTDVDELRALRRPRRRFYNIGHRSSSDIARDLSRVPSLLSRQGLKTAMQAIFHPGRDSSSSGSMITLPVPRTGTVRDATAARPVRDFDIGALRRVRRQKERNEVRNGTYLGGFEDVRTPRVTTRHATVPGALSSNVDGGCSSDSDFSACSCISEGSEVDAVGGTVVTEGTDKAHTAANIPTAKSAVCIRTKAVSYDDDNLDRDVGLQSIMAQA